MDSSLLLALNMRMTGLPCIQNQATQQQTQQKTQPTIDPNQNWKIPPPHQEPNKNKQSHQTIPTKQSHQAKQQPNNQQPNNFHHWP